MTNGSIALACCLLLALESGALANTTAQPSTTRPLRIVLPADGDDYSKLVAQAAAQDSSLDFHALRFAYLKSASRKRGGFRPGDSIKEKMLAAAKSGDNAGVRAAAEDLLSVKYVDLSGQKFLRQSCEHMRDDGCAKQANFVEMGLLKSIVQSGDGKTCPTGWEVVGVDEEYFMLAMLGAAPKSQSLLMGKPGCDALSATAADGKDVTYFFRIDAVLEDENAMMKSSKP